MFKDALFDSFFGAWLVMGSSVEGGASAPAVRRRYTVVGKRGVVVRAGVELDSPVVARLPRGAVVEGDASSSVPARPGRPPRRRRLVRGAPRRAGPARRRVRAARGVARPAAAAEGYLCDLEAAPPHERLEVATVALG
ncbi:peptide-methionine (S)-S-oxide reductase [Aureococcus anophagefferens]|nr:peptide-methionine (S)-S-oxide reductase [Aureococcus anophagefferens]